MTKLTMTKAAYAKVAKGPESALAFVRTTAKDYRDASTALDGRTVTAIYALRAAVATGILFGDGKAAGAMTTEAFADLFGVGKSNVTKWRDLSRYLDLPGATADDDLFSRLRGGAITTPAVRDAVRADDATTASVQSAYDSVFLPDGKRREDTGKGKRRGGRPATGDATPEVPEVSGIEGCMALLTLLASKVGDLSTEDWAKVETKMEDIRTKEVTIRTKAAAKAAKVAPRTGGTPRRRKAARKAVKSAA